MKIQEMDEQVPFSSQLQNIAGPVVFINKFTLIPEDVECFLNEWGEEIAYLMEQPGYVSAQLHRGVAGSHIFFSYAIWQSVEQFKNAYTDIKFTVRLAKYPQTVISSPHLFQRVAVPNICPGP